MTKGGGVIMLAAGGTGGHLFPAFALAEALGRRGRIVDLVTDMRGDRYGSGFPARQVHQVPSATASGRDPLTLAKTAATLARGVAAAVKLLGDVKPAAVVGFGGYPTFPPLLAARMRSIPSLIHEQNAVLGRANRLLSKRVDVIATSFERTRFVDGPLLAKARFTGNPVRDVVLRASGRPYRSPEPSGPVRLLVFGGSQGARYFSETVPGALATVPPLLRSRLEVVQQCRAEDLDAVRAAYAASGIRAELETFFRDLPERLAESHLVIGRAGASSIAELTVIGRPSILVPLPHALDNDQLQNASRLAESGGAWCIEQKDLSAERLGGEIARLIASPELLSQVAASAKAQGKPDAVERLADLVEELAAGRREGRNAA